jgi:hypothetical protein
MEWRQIYVSTGVIRKIIGKEGHIYTIREA